MIPCSPLLLLCSLAFSAASWAKPHVAIGVDHREYLVEFQSDPNMATGLASRWKTSDYATNHAATDTTGDQRIPIRTSQRSVSGGKQRSRYFYVGLQGGVLFIWPFVGITAGLRVPDLPSIALETDYVVGLRKGEVSPWYEIGLVWGKHKPRGLYAKLGILKFTKEPPPHDYNRTTAVGIGAEMNLNDSVSLRPEVGLQFLIPDDLENYDYPILFPFWDLRLRVLFDL